MYSATPTEPLFSSPPPISWTALLVAAFVAVGLSFLLNLFSIAIGLGAITITSTGETKLAAGGVISLTLGSIIVMFTSGWVAGYLGQTNCPKRNQGILYGFASWCVAFCCLISARGRHACSGTRLTRKLGNCSVLLLG